ncbi:MAG: hypothetical protein WCA85_26910 [Paraburkholderia sp.]|uniref:hypothetical protein n=1 Tax=Paraburkholderia sp. TaxID=1926495 RepID=UPI003C57FF06
MKKFTGAVRVAICAGACTTLAACLSSTPTWDRTFGSAVTQITVMQTLNPAASDNDDPVAGIDGPAAQAAQSNYVKSFTKPTPPSNSFTIGVSSGDSSN